MSMAWCAGQKYTTDAVAGGDEDNAEFFRVLRLQILGDPSAVEYDEEGRELAPLKPSSSLEFMFLDLNKQSMQLLLQALYYHKSVHEVKKIVFHGCRIRDQVSLELLAHLFHLYTHWTHVEISCLCQGLGNEQARILILEILKSKDLEHLNISSMGISDGLVLWRDLLCPQPAAKAAPRSIVMRSSRINFDHTHDFLSIYLPLIQNNNNTLDNNKQLQQQHHSLKHLDLSACRMDDRAMETVAQGLGRMNVVLESLALKGNRLSPKSVPVLADLLHDHPHLKALDVSMNTRLFSTTEEQQPPGAARHVDKMIRAALGTDSRLERLVLSKTSVGETAAILMLQLLETNVVLEELDLNFCLLGERVMAQLVTSLPRMRGLQHLLLHGLHFHQRNAATNPHDQRQCLWNALQANTSLVKIQGLNMFLGAGRPELANVILEHLSERNHALHQARNLHQHTTTSSTSQCKTAKQTKKPMPQNPEPRVWPKCLERLGRGSWTASAVYLFLQNNASAVAECG